MSSAGAWPPDLPPKRMLDRPKPILQTIYDLVGAPLRMLLLPDRAAEALGLTSLRAERMAVVLPALRGRVLDVGAGDNALLRAYRARAACAGTREPASVGVDVHDWGGGCTIVESCAHLAFPSGSFDCVAFVACLNHIPERRDALCEARRVLRPDGRLVLTMIGRTVGSLGHRVWWYSEEKHRHVADGEVMGLDRAEVLALLGDGGFEVLHTCTFGYGMNRLYVARPRASPAGAV